MRQKIFIILATLIIIIKNTNGGKILVLDPTPVPSHFILGKALVEELLNRKHEVVFLSAFGMPTAKGNLRDVIIDETAQMRNTLHDYLLSLHHISIISQFNSILEKAYFITELTLNSTKVQELISSDEQFDLVIITAFLNEAHIGLADRFNCPLIILSTMGSNIWINHYLSNPASPSYIPHLLSTYSQNMDFWERMANTIETHILEIIYSSYYLPKQNELMHKYFPSAPSLEEVKRQHLALIFLNSHPSISPPKPIIPNMIEIGGFHVKKGQKLPKDLNDFLNNAKEGFILFSMGSNLKSSTLPNETREILLRVFAQLPYQVLWKFEEQLPNKPKNVKIDKWLPQNDILAHPNIILFITHGGFLSTTEAVYHCVPIVGIPVFGDQQMNMAVAQKMGIGRFVTFKDLTYENLRDTVEEVINNKTYRENVERRSKLLKDQPLLPIETAMFWIEYVLRNRNCDHFRIGAMNLKWYQVMSFDVFLFLFSVISISIFICYFVIKKCFYHKTHEHVHHVKKLQ